jgi:prenyltransferase beta subunit
MKHKCSLAVLLAVTSTLASFAGAQEPVARPPAREQRGARPGGIAAEPNQVRGDEITAQQKAAVERGLAWLAARQGKDGGYAGEDGGAGPKHAGITALAGLAFMQAGNLPGRGKYGKEVQRCLEYVLSACQPTGLICADMNHGPMYGHGFATLFLAELYGMTGNEDVKEKLQKAVALIQKTQNVEGGWRYQPAPYDADISVTICQVMALRAARDAGLKVEKSVIDKSIQYVKNCQSAGDGGFSYQPSMRGHGSGFGRTAAGVASLYYAGEFEGEPLEKGLKYLKRFAGGRNSEQAAEGMYFYANYYAVQAMFLAGGDYWASFYPTVRDQLIKRQAQSGSWQGEAGEEYATAMALIILQMPNRYLPVYAGKGPGS